MRVTRPDHVTHTATHHETPAKTGLGVFSGLDEDLGERMGMPLMPFSLRRERQRILFQPIQATGVRI